MEKRGPRIVLPAMPGVTFENYVNALAALGARASIAVPGDPLDGYDGLLLPGGGDMDPALYGQADTACRDVDRALDDWQLLAAERFISAGKPVLGVCRGHQVLNVYFGGTLVQHLPQSPRHSRDAQARADRVHATRAAVGSFVAAFYGEAPVVNSSHHQGVKVVGRGLRAAQWSDDGVIEAIEHERLPVWGVQWHPERMAFAFRRSDTVDGARLIAWFLKKCGG